MIKNVDHFVKAIVKFSLGEFLPEYFAMTHSGFVRRNIFSIDSTGLSIHLQDDRTMDLAELARKYGQDPNLVFFANACLKHGFMINSYSPTSIIADLASPKMREYMKKRNCYMGADILERTGTTLAGGLGHKHMLSIRMETVELWLQSMPHTMCMTFLATKLSMCRLSLKQVRTYTGTKCQDKKCF